MAERNQGDDATGPRLKLARPTAQLLLAIVAAVAVAIVFAVTQDAVQAGKDSFGIFSSFVLGVVAALAWLGAAGGLLAWLAVPRGPPVVIPPPRSSVLTRDLGPLLKELEAVRVETQKRVRARLWRLMPIGAIAGAALALLTPPIDAARSSIIIYPLGGLLVGYGLSVWLPSQQYESLFKARVMAALVARFGALTYRQPPRPDLARLRQFHLLPHFSRASASDQILGQYRGVRISVTQLHLTDGPDGKPVFDGLLTEVTLQNRLLGVTAIAKDAGALGNLIEATRASGFRRVGLEDPAFERDYEVWSTDQVMARALITPTFMQRFQALERRQGFARSLALAQDDVLLMAIPRTGPNLFQPPDFRTPAADADVLKHLFEDIEAVLRATDSVIDLDDATRDAAKPAR